MRPNIVSEAGLQTRLGQWWEGIPFLTSVVVGVCATIYVVCLLAGYDSFYEVCFLPSAVVSRFQVYRIFTAILFHGSLLHVLFNMMALVPLGSELERIMGSVRLLYIIILLAITNALLHLLIALLVTYNPIHPFEYLMNECAIGFSGILFSMIVIETSLSGQQYRSVFGLFNVPAKWYAWILLVVFQLVMSNVSLLGHLCGILSGFAYSYGLFNILIPGPSFYSKIEASLLAGLQTRLGQWWEGIPFLTSVVVGVCATIYVVCLLAGYDSFYEVCFLPSAVVSRFQVYRIFTAILFHGSLLHVLFNMMALVPLGSELERIMGSVRLLYIIILLAITNALLHLLIALLVTYNPIHPFEYLMNECAIGFSGILFSMIVIETSLSGQQYRSVFGLFNVPAKWYAWILLVVFQLVMSNVSLLGHLCGILSGFAYSYGLFNILIPGPSFYSKIEASLLSSCVRRPKFILCTGGNPSASIPTFTSQGTMSSGLLSGNLWRNLSSWIPQRETSSQTTQDNRTFPGRGRTLGSGAGQAVSDVNSESNLQDRLLDSDSENVSDAGRPLLDPRQTVNTTAEAGPDIHVHNQDYMTSEGEIQKLVAMGFERTQVEVALAAADGDINVAVEILSQQG